MGTKWAFRLGFKVFLAWAVALIAVMVALAQGPRSRGPFYPPDMAWAKGILFPPPRAFVQYCYEPNIAQTLVLSGPEPLLKRVKQIHTVVWGEGLRRVEFRTPMGLALEACARLGPETAFSAFPDGFVPYLLVYGSAASWEELKRWRATLSLRDAKGRLLTSATYYDRFPYFQDRGGRLEGYMTYKFWDVSGTAMTVLELYGAAGEAYTIEFSLRRGGKEEVYRIRYVEYPNLW